MQVLIAQSAIETFADAVLPGRAWFDLKDLHADHRQPLLDRRRDEFRTVVASKSFWNAVHAEQLYQRVDCIFARDATPNLDRQALPSVFVDDVQEANGSSMEC
ncbi:hypothetical protein SAMN06265222_1011023 [Neorhodopirellula lusitana]|uniref:Uncharacterized protein n=1 Tax=Neorhodopirellula lusitana TaxID=445327 RepID=A0ABY1PRH9_9BACT|nr:hypothetical protein SAMN06265222_1011023 [Neorhodopirellula lusitana]